MSSGAGQRLFQLTPVSSTGGTAVPLTTTQHAVRSVVIQAATSNVGSVAIGDASVNLTNGMLLGPGDSMTLAAENDSRYNDFDLSEVYMYSGSTGNIVKVMGFRRRV
jgi:hypothetical protein